MPANTQWNSKTFVLNTGAHIPAIGLGTWQAPPHKVRKAVKAALDAGYRHIDTAHAYGNEYDIGLGIKDSGVPREDVWITTKLDNSSHKVVQDAAKRSLDLLGTDYIDLYLMHWPCSVDPQDRTKLLPDWDFVQTWIEMQKLLSSGCVKNIGVANFGITALEKLLADQRCDQIPAVNQIELHPHYPSRKLLNFCKERGIHVTAYSCLGSTNSPLTKDKTIQKIATARKRSVAQILLVWGLQRGTSVIPKSVTPSRIEENWDLGAERLSTSDFGRINNIPDRFKACDDSWLPVKVFFDDDT